MSFPLNFDSIPARYLYTPEDKLEYPRVLCVCVTKDSKGKEVKNIVAPFFDKDSHRFYSDDSKTKLYCKAVSLSLTCPIKILVKWAYHLLCIGMFVELGKTFGGAEEWKSLRTRCFLELQDMGRTPYYGAALCVNALMGAFIAPFKPEILYKMRINFRFYELELNRQNKSSSWIQAPCFSSFDLFKERNGYSSFEQLSALSAETYINNRRIPCWSIFDNCGLPINPNKPYYSPVIAKKLLSEMLEIEGVRIDVKQGKYHGPCRTLVNA